MTRTTIWNDDGFDIWSNKSLRDLIKLMSCSIFVWIWLCLEIGGKFKELIGFHFRKRHLWYISLWSWWHLWNQTWHRDSVDGHYDFKSCSFFSVLLRPCRTLLDFICHFHLLERFHVILINIFLAFIAKKFYFESNLFNEIWREFSVSFSCWENYRSWCQCW